MDNGGDASSSHSSPSDWNADEWAIDQWLGFEEAAGLGDQNESDRLNFSDVLEAISLADPTFGAGAGVEEAMARPPAHVDEPYVRIVEQPASKALRFRYECEGRSAGSIPGVNNTPENKTYPTIKICGYIGPVVIVVSCVTKDQPFRAHPHNLVGRERCDRGVCTIPTRITEECNEYQFKNLGIQCVKRRDIAEALRVRETLRVDPFRSGFAHKNHPQSIDLNAVRLCFQVFLPGATERSRRPLAPVVSDIIYDKKAMSELQIMRASHCSGTARGGTQVILLCEKVNREDTAVVFYQEENNQVVWEDSAVIMLVHKQAAIAFQTPPFRNPNTSDHVSVYFQLKRLTDNARSNSLPFEYIPEFPDSNKRRKMVNTLLQEYEHESMFQEQKHIKSEPRDKLSPHHISSPPLHGYQPQYGDQNWGLGQGGLVVPGPSHVHNPFLQEMTWAPTYQAVSPNMQPVSPNMQQMAQNLQAMSPNVQVLSPMQSVSPNMQAMSPGMQPMSPNMQVLSPNVQTMSPSMQGMSPIPVTMANVGRISPNIAAQQNLGQISQPDYNQMPQQSAMDQHSASLSNLLLDQGDSIMLNSSELSSLSSMLNRANPDLSDSLIL